MRLNVPFGILAFVGLALSGSAQTETEQPSDDIRFVASEAIKRGGFPLSNIVEADGLVVFVGSPRNYPGQGNRTRRHSRRESANHDKHQGTLEIRGLGDGPNP